MSGRIERIPENVLEAKARDAHKVPRKRFPISKSHLLSQIIVACLGLVLATTSDAGSIGIHAYNPAKEKAIQRIFQSYTNVPLLQVFEIEETNLNALAKAEFDLWDRQTVLQRDL